jgi:hypothetical protein
MPWVHGEVILAYLPTTWSCRRQGVGAGKPALWQSSFLTLSLGVAGSIGGLSKSWWPRCGDETVCCPMDVCPGLTIIARYGALALLTDEHSWLLLPVKERMYSRAEFSRGFLTTSTRGWHDGAAD